MKDFTITLGEKMSGVSTIRQGGFRYPNADGYRETSDLADLIGLSSMASAVLGNVENAELQQPVEAWSAMVVRTVPLTSEGVTEVSRAKTRLQLVRALYNDFCFRDEVHARALEDWPVETILRPAPSLQPRPRLGGPVLSLLCDAQDAHPDEIERLIRSIRAQTYPRWQLCLCDGEAAPTLAKYAVDRHRGTDPRLRFLRTAQPYTTAGAVNGAAELLTGDYIGVVGVTDELTPEALAYMMQGVTQQPLADVLYSDEEVRSGSGFATIRKPAWSPDLQTCRPYLGRLTLLRTELWLELGGLDARYAGAEEDALALRATQRAAHVVHVPEVTCRRAATTPYGGSLMAALADYVRGIDDAASVSGGLVPGSFRVDWASPSSRGDVTVIVIGGGLDAGGSALDGRGEAADRRAVRRLHAPAVDGAALNAALQEVSTEDVVFLHAGAQALADDWVEVLTGHARRLGVGLAAAYMGADAPAASGEGLASAALVRNDAAPAWPGAVAMRRSVLRWMGGFDASKDVGAALTDLSVRLARQGFRTVQTPFVIARAKAGATSTTTSSGEADCRP